MKSLEKELDFLTKVLYNYREVNIQERMNRKMSGPITDKLVEVAEIRAVADESKVTLAASASAAGWTVGLYGYLDGSYEVEYMGNTVFQNMELEMVVDTYNCCLADAPAESNAEGQWWGYENQHGITIKKFLSENDMDAARERSGNYMIRIAGPVEAKTKKEAAKKMGLR